MSLNESTFQSLGPRLRDITLTHFESSERYRGTIGSFDRMLLLADRIVRACEQHPELSRVPEITRPLRELAEPTEGSVHDLIGKLELWIKAVVRFAVPDRETQRKAADEGRNRRQFNLFGCFVDLELATERELNAQEKNDPRLKDPVTQRIWWANVLRNDSIHRPNLSDFGTRSDITIGACVAILAPLYLHHDSIANRLRSLITRSPEFGGSPGVNKMVDSERRGHLRRFRGRDNDVGDVLHLLEANRGNGYVLVTAEEGGGKSALCAKVSDSFREAAEAASGQAWGAHASTVKAEMSWFPGAILHCGKSARDPETIALFLLSQINSMTLEPVPFSERIARRDAIEAEGELGVEEALPEEAESSKNGTAGSDSQEENKMNRRAQLRSEQLRRAIYVGLDQLAHERGDAVLIIDALEEISEDGATLGFLPQKLPPRVAGLITAQANTPAARWAKDHLTIAEPISLRRLVRSDMPALSGVTDDTADGKAFNGNLFAASGGLPLAVRRILDGPDVRKILDSTDTVRPALSKLQLVSGTNELHARQAAAWTDLGDVGKLSLMALALFEPVAALALPVLQAFLAGKLDHVPDLSDLRELLEPVANQVQGFDEGKIKLASRPFAVYVREKRFSRLDLAKPLEWLRRAIVADVDVDISTLATFIDYWGSGSRNAQQRAQASGVLDDLVVAEDGERLYEIAQRLRVWDTKATPHAVRSLELSARLGFPAALRLLGLLTIDGRGREPDAGEGMRLLRVAYEKGDGRAMILLGHRLLDGRGLPADPAEGLACLESALRQNVPDAKYALGARLVFGQGVPTDANRGAELLEQAAAAHDSRAMLLLGVLFLEGDVVAKDPHKGRYWLVQAAEAGNDAAMIQLAERLIDGAGLEADQQAGLQWFERAVSTGNTSAMIRLATRFIRGKGLSRDDAKGGSLLARAAEAGDEEAMRRLGIRLLKGDGVATDANAGLAWLEKAMDAGDEAARNLVHREYIGRLKVPAQRPAAERWVRQVIDGESKEARNALAFALYKAGEKQLAVTAFRKSMQEGDGTAANNVFYLLRRGDVASEVGETNPHALVDSLVAEKHPFAMVNKALALAAGFACDVDWKAADALIKEVVIDEGNKDLVEWWHRLTTEGEGEGHLVLGWLSHHGIITDPDGRRPQQRFEEAGKLGWTVPAWLRDAASA